jgi:hypothetical protein
MMLAGGTEAAVLRSHVLRNVTTFWSCIMKMQPTEVFGQRTFL